MPEQDGWRVDFGEDDLEDRSVPGHADLTPVQLLLVLLWLVSTILSLQEADQFGLRERPAFLLRECG